MKLIVWQETDWKPSKFSNGENKRVVFKSLDETDKTSYYLNIDTAHGVTDKWLPFIKLGNILDVNLMPGRNIINKFGQVTLIKEQK